MTALLTTSNAHLFDSISGCENRFLGCFHFHNAPHLLSRVFSSLLNADYLARRGRNDRTELPRVRANRENGLAGVVAIVCKPPKPSGTTRSTNCPVRRSIARISNSSTGPTILI